MSSRLAIAGDEQARWIVTWRVAGMDDGGDDHSAPVVIRAIPLAELATDENRGADL
jgi:hypothetical protein